MSSQDSQQQDSPQGNLLLFLALVFLIFLSWYHLRSFLNPTQPELPAEKGKKGGKANLPDTIPNEPAPTPDEKTITLGDRDRSSAFNLYVRLDPRGAGVRLVTLNKFLASDIDGRP